MYDDPASLARLVAGAARPLLIGLDIDGVLAPIVAHADDSQLLDGVADALTRLGAVDGVVIAAVSGRTLDSMRTFGLPEIIRLVGSHGLEDRGRPLRPLDADETGRLAALRALADESAELAGDGAWVEQKSASVALHVREADPDRAGQAVETLERAAALVPGAHAKHGSQVLELFARAADKGAAMLRLAAEADAATSVFVGDDITDEDAFCALGPADITIKVGDAPTVAQRRLADPHAALEWLQQLAVALTA